jgi:hypothetical protein
MKYCITILLLLIGCTALCQDITDTIAIKRTIDSLKQQIRELKYALKKTEYDAYLKDSLYRIDTVYCQKAFIAPGAQDSLVTHYLTRTGKIIRIVKDLYIKDPADSLVVRTDSCITFYNRKGLMEYQEYWRCAFDVCAYDTDGEGMGGSACSYVVYSDAELTGFFRVKYDATDSVVMLVMPIEGVLFRDRYCRSDQGNYIADSEQVIGADEFWDD